MTAEQKDVLPTRFGLISDVLGRRCSKFDVSCMTCMAWAMSDEIERLERERSEWAAVAATRNVNLAIIAEERDQLADLLQALCDEQNGPPLERRKGEWQRAYDQARAYLRRAHYSGPQQGTRPREPISKGE